MKTARDNGQVLGATSSYDAYDNADTHDFKPMTAEEVQKLRLQQPLLSIWRVVLAQMVVGLTVAVLTWLFTGRISAAWSAALYMVSSVFTKRLPVVIG